MKTNKENVVNIMESTSNGMYNELINSGISKEQIEDICNKFEYLEANVTKNQSVNQNFMLKDVDGLIRSVEGIKNKKVRDNVKKAVSLQIVTIVNYLQLVYRDNVDFYRDLITLREKGFIKDMNGKDIDCKVMYKQFGDLSMRTSLLVTDTGKIFKNLEKENDADKREKMVKESIRKVSEFLQLKFDKFIKTFDELSSENSFIDSMTIPCYLQQVQGLKEGLMKLETITSMDSFKTLKSEDQKIFTEFRDNILKAYFSKENMDKISYCFNKLKNNLYDREEEYKKGLKDQNKVEFENDLEGDKKIVEFFEKNFEDMGSRYDNIAENIKNNIISKLYPDIEKNRDVILEQLKYKDEGNDKDRAIKEIALEILKEEQRKNEEKIAREKSTKIKLIKRILGINDKKNHDKDEIEKINNNIKEIINEVETYNSKNSKKLKEGFVKKYEKASKFFNEEMIEAISERSSFGTCKNNKIVDTLKGVEVNEKNNAYNYTKTAQIKVEVSNNKNVARY